MVLGNGPLPARGGLARVHDALAWLSLIGMYLMLGLLVFPSRLLPVAGIGLAIAAFLGLVARPLVVWLRLLPFRLPAREVLYIGWVGLRGAVPIVPETFPVLYRVPEAERVFDIVLFLVVVNALIPGSTVRWLTRKWNLLDQERPTPPAVLVVRDGALVACRGETELLPGDHVYVFMHRQDRPYIELLFGRSQDGV